MSKLSSPDNVGDGLVLLREMIDLRREIRKIADTSSVIPPAMPVKPRQTIKAVNSEELRQYRDRGSRTAHTYSLALKVGIGCVNSSAKRQPGGGILQHCPTSHGPKFSPLLLMFLLC